MCKTDENWKKALRELRDILKRYGIKLICDYEFCEIKYKGYVFTISEIEHCSE